VALGENLHYKFRTMRLLVVWLALVLSAGLVSCGGSKIVKGTEKPIYSPVNPAPKPLETNLNIDLSRKLGINVPKSANPKLMNQVGDWLGVPYRLGGNDKNGVDCSGFINQVFKNVYEKQLPRVAAEMHAAIMPVGDKERREGDLVFFKINSTKVTHAGIFLFDDFFAHASTSRGVIISRLQETYWARYYVGSGRVLP
jgi:lipoprotein Spr